MLNLNSQNYLHLNVDQIKMPKPLEEELVEEQLENNTCSYQSDYNSSNIELNTSESILAMQNQALLGITTSSSTLDKNAILKDLREYAYESLIHEYPAVLMSAYYDQVASEVEARMSDYIDRRIQNGQTLPEKEELRELFLTDVNRRLSTLRCSDNEELQVKLNIDTTPYNKLCQRYLECYSNVFVSNPEIFEKIFKYSYDLAEKINNEKIPNGDTQKDLDFLIKSEVNTYIWNIAMNEQDDGNILQPPSNTVEMPKYLTTTSNSQNSNVSVSINNHTAVTKSGLTATDPNFFPSTATITINIGGKISEIEVTTDITDINEYTNTINQLKSVINDLPISVLQDLAKEVDYINITGHSMGEVLAYFCTTEDALTFSTINSLDKHTFIHELYHAVDCDAKDNYATERDSDFIMAFLNFTNLMKEINPNLATNYSFTNPKELFAEIMATINAPNDWSHLTKIKDTLLSSDHEKILEAVELYGLLQEKSREIVIQRNRMSDEERLDRNNEKKANYKLLQSIVNDKEMVDFYYNEIAPFIIKTNPSSINFKAFILTYMKMGGQNQKLFYKDISNLLLEKELAYSRKERVQILKPLREFCKKLDEIVDKINNVNKNTNIDDANKENSINPNIKNPEEQKPPGWNGVDNEPNSPVDNGNKDDVFPPADGGGNNITLPDNNGWNTPYNNEEQSDYNNDNSSVIPPNNGGNKTPDIKLPDSPDAPIIGQNDYSIFRDSIDIPDINIEYIPRNPDYNNGSRPNDEGMSGILPSLYPTSEELENYVNDRMNEYRNYAIENAKQKYGENAVVDAKISYTIDDKGKLTFHVETLVTKKGEGNGANGVGNGSGGQGEGAGAVGNGTDGVGSGSDDQIKEAGQGNGTEKGANNNIPYYYPGVNININDYIDPNTGKVDTQALIKQWVKNGGEAFKYTDRESIKNAWSALDAAAQSGDWESFWTNLEELTKPNNNISNNELPNEKIMDEGRKLYTVALRDLDYAMSNVEIASNMINYFNNLGTWSNRNSLAERALQQEVIMKYGALLKHLALQPMGIDAFNRMFKDLILEFQTQMHSLGNTRINFDYEQLEKGYFPADEKRLQEEQALEAYERRCDNIEKMLGLPG